MNVKAKPFKLDLKKIAFIVILLAIVGYKYYADNIAKPQVAEANSQSTTQEPAQKKFPSDAYQVNFPESKSSSGKTKSDNGFKFTPQKPSGSGTQSQSSTTNSQQKNSNKPFLISSGGRNKKSPAGLIYGMGGGGEHRTDHVLRHAEDQPGRPSHGVFNAQGDNVFRLIDEAYELVKQKSKQVKSENSRGNMAHVIDMKRKIGFKGGQSGKRSGNPPLYKIKLILADGNRVITAYPY